MGRGDAPESVRDEAIARHTGCARRGRRLFEGDSQIPLEQVRIAQGAGYSSSTACCRELLLVS